MARPLRLQYPGAIYHVTFRGNERKVLFKGEADRQRLLQLLAVARERYQTRIYLACLMPNHVHLLLETPRGNLSALMGQVLTAYAVYFNRRYRRVGHLTQGRYHAQVVEGDAYLLKLGRYIHLNPVCGRPWQGVTAEERRQALRAYRWSTYRSYAGLDKPWPWIEYAPLLAMVTAKGDSPQESYRDYVEMGLAESDESFVQLYRQSRLGLGSEAFVADLRRRYWQVVGGRRRPEDAAWRRGATVRSPEEVLKGVAKLFGVTVAELRERRRNSLLRAAAAWALQRHGGLNQRAVAAALGMGTGAAASQQLGKWRAAVDKDSRWRALATAIDRHLGVDQ